MKKLTIYHLIFILGTQYINADIAVEKTLLPKKDKLAAISSSKEEDISASKTKNPKYKDLNKDDHEEDEKNEEKTSHTTISPVKNPLLEEISFRFNQAPLLDIINLLSEKMGYNIVIPAGQQTITEKISLDLDKKVTVEEAWELLLHYLRICGYSVSFQKEFILINKVNPAELVRQTYPLYVATDPELLPDSNEKIRYLYYFYNLQVASDATTHGAISDILLSVLSKDTGILADETINGIIITDDGHHIKAAIQLLKELDARKFLNEGREIFQLKHTNAAQVATYMNTLINPTGKQTVSDIGSGGQTASYFSKGIRIIPEPRTNSLILLGKKDALARVKLFLEEFIDIPLETGESILHIYPLQHLDAATFAQTLTSILASQANASQSSGSASTSNAGEQYFKDVKVMAESTSAVNPASLTNSAGGASSPQSGNRLIIAAKHDDWLRIEKLIKDLDKPQLQVAIEVLIVDLTLEENRSLGAQLRNLSNLSIGSANFQTSHLGGNEDGVFVEKTAVNATEGDLLQANLLQATGTDSLGNQENMASGFTAGSFVLSFKDTVTNGMWLVTQLLKSYNDAKILSQPFIVALNNQSCSFKSTESRLLAGGSSVIPGGGGVQTYKETVSATLGVTITPTISRDQRITLAIDITITEYQNTNSTVILNRAIQTNVNIGDGEILVLGGLTKTQIAKSETATPLLAQIPIVGNLFKKRQDVKTKENLLVFISPRVINPKKEGKLDPYTAIKISRLNSFFDDHQKERDPITHWFFGKVSDDLEVQRLKSWGRKDLFVPDGEADSTLIIVAKDEPLPEESIKKTGNLIPSPDKTESSEPKIIVGTSDQLLETKKSTATKEKTATGMSRIFVKPIKVERVPTPDLVVEALTEPSKKAAQSEKTKSSDKKIIERNTAEKTATGMPRIKVKPPKSIHLPLLEDPKKPSDLIVQSPKADGNQELIELVSNLTPMLNY